jgi:hypothetical protein
MKKFNLLTGVFCVCLAAAGLTAWKAKPTPIKQKAARSPQHHYYLNG